ncbi:MAG: serine hydrolase [Taibaiella sp.]|nr:serine hydrolase [Taibaiella sp.]
MKTSNFNIPVNLLAVLAGGVISFFIFSSHAPSILNKAEATTVVQAPATRSETVCSWHIMRETRYKFIRPILYREKECESEIYSSLKASLGNYIEDCKTSGQLISSSVYVRNLTNGDWIDCNPQLTFNPGSLAKVPLLLTYLHLAETDHSILDSKVKYDKLPDERIPTQTFENKSIKLGNTYTVKELLEYMSVYSDNSATFLLNSMTNPENYKTTFYELGVPVPSMKDRGYEISAKDYSRFLWVLYNSSYVSRPLSEFGCSLLSKAEFRQGLLKNIPDTIKVMHKFGEFGNVAAGIHQLHESAVIYLAGKPYEITVMTRGKNKEVLPGIISHLSDMVFEHMKTES